MGGDDFVVGQSFGRVVSRIAQGEIEEARKVRRKISQREEGEPRKKKDFGGERF